MNKLSLFGAFAVSGFLIGCEGKSETSAPVININVTEEIVVGEEPPSDTIVNTDLPVFEDFNNVADTAGFYSAAYKSLASESESDAKDNFYHSAAGVYDEDPVSGERTLSESPNNWITADADQKMRLGNSRMTIGQIVSVLALPDGFDPRNKSTPGNGVETGVSWGELDLSEPYTISFCIVEISDGGNLQIYVDNNSSSSGNSIHGSGSRIYTAGGSTHTAGQRLTVSSDVGTANSFIQFRMDSGGYVVFDDLIIEKDSAPYGGAVDDCSTKTTMYGQNQTGEVVEVVTGTPFTGIPDAAPFSVDFSVDKDTFFGGETATDFVSISSDVGSPFYKVTSGDSRITMDGTALSMTNARFTIGDSGTATTATDQPSGDLDLSVPYRITIVLSDFTDNDDATDAAGQFVVYLDNNTTGSSNSIHGGSSKAVTLEATDPSITGFPHTITFESTDLGTANSFIQLRADSRVGNVTIQSVSIEYTGAPPANDNLILSEDFSAADTDTFMSAAYLPLPTDPASPMYVATSGGSRINVSGGQLAMANARFTVGDTGVASAAATTPSGTLDLSSPYTITFTILELTDADPADDPGKVQVYVDNNTSSSGNSIHEGSSKIEEIAVGEITSFPHTVTIDSALGTTTSFIQLRADSRVGNYIIDDFSIEYQ